MARVADHVREGLMEDAAEGRASLALRPAIGMAPFKLGVTSGLDVLRIARSAAQDARDGGRLFSIYSGDQDAAHQRRFALLNDISAALEADDELQLVFQPRVDMRSGRCVGAEALIRWNHPTLGAVSPGEFIPIIEQTGLIEQPVVWKFCSGVITHPGIPT